MKWVQFLSNQYNEMRELDILSSKPVLVFYKQSQGDENLPVEGLIQVEQ
jgi:hypothetical protein